MVGGRGRKVEYFIYYLGILNLIDSCMKATLAHCIVGLSRGEVQAKAETRRIDVISKHGGRICCPILRRTSSVNAAFRRN